MYYQEYQENLKQISPWKKQANHEKSPIFVFWDTSSASPSTESLKNYSIIFLLVLKTIIKSNFVVLLFLEKKKKIVKKLGGYSSSSPWKIIFEINDGFFTSSSFKNIKVLEKHIPKNDIPRLLKKIKLRIFPPQYSSKKLNIL